MRNRNRTARYVERDTRRVLQDLRHHADTHPVFAEQIRQRGISLTDEGLRQEASRSAFRGLRAWRRLIPSVAEKAISAHENVLVDVWALIRDVTVEKD